MGNQDNRIGLSQDQYALVDAELYDSINHRKWSAAYDSETRTYYAVRSGYTYSEKRRTEQMAWVVAGKPAKGFVVDHINGDTLDNRRNNLRIVTVRENSQNTHRHRSGRLVGINWHPQMKKWIARIHVNGKKLHLGCFTTPVAAHAAYKQAEVLYGTV